MAKSKWFVWKGKPIETELLQALTGLSITRRAMLDRIRKAEKAGVDVSTLHTQIEALKDAPLTAPVTVTDETEIPLTADVDEAKRLKTIREALLIEQKRKQAEIETKLKRREVFYLDAILPAWSNMVISVREALLGAIPTLVDRVLPCTDRDEAVDRAETELIRHINRLSDFDLERTLNEDTGDEEWEFNETESE